MALKDPYCDVACADVFLADSTDWNNATVAEKERALFWGMIYIDTNYKCPDLELDQLNPSDNVLYANSLLAEDYIQGTLLPTDGSKNGSIKGQRDKAGSVETETKYAAPYQANPQQDVDALLSSECTKRNGNYVLITRT